MKAVKLEWSVILYYALFVVMYCIAFIVGMVLAPILPAFAIISPGWLNNHNSYGSEPRLPKWLRWFDTYHDNSLYGDTGWREEHCKKYWNTYVGMVLWLWRNPVAGFCWDVLSFNIYDIYVGHKYDGIVVAGDTGVDKNNTDNGSFLIHYLGTKYFQYRVIKTFGRIKWCFEAGWLLDVYVKDEHSYSTKPKPQFIFQPQWKILKK